MGRLVTISLLLALAAGTAVAQETFVADLVPRPGTGSTGSGDATLTLNAAETQLSYTISFSGLSGPEEAAHIHKPDGSIAHTLPLGSPKVGVWQDPGLINILSLRAGQLFILIHTTPNPAGELRGDILPEQLPVEPSTWGAIKALFRSQRS